MVNAEKRKHFIEITKSKSKSHMNSAWYWDILYTFFTISVTIICAVITLLAVLTKYLPFYVVPIIGGVVTLLAAMHGFLKPADRRQSHLESGKMFKMLMFRMVRCKTKEDYDELWNELYQEIIDEPFVKEKYLKGAIDLERMQFPMTKELKRLIEKPSSDDEDGVEKAKVDGDDDDLGKMAPWSDAEDNNNEKTSLLSR